MNQINILNYALNSFEISENKDNKLIVDNIIGSSFLAYKIYKERNENILLLTSTNEEANKIYRTINSLINQNEIILIPSDELIRVEYLSQSKDMLAQQIIGVYNMCLAKHKIVIAPIQSLIKFYPSKKLFLDSCITIKKGEHINLNDLKNKLSRLGYTRVNKIDSSLQYASRGDILDIYSLNYEDPIRIEFFDDEIESIRQFKVNSQTSFIQLNEVKILPASLNLLTDEEYKNAKEKIINRYRLDIEKKNDEDYKNKLLENINDDLELLKDCNFSNKFYKYMGFLQENHYNLTTFLDCCITIVSNNTNFNKIKKSVYDDSLKFLMELHSSGKTISHLEYFSLYTPLFQNAIQTYILDDIFSNAKNEKIIDLKKPSLISTKQSLMLNIFKTYLDLKYKVICVLNDPINYRKTIELLKSLAYKYKENDDLNITFEDNIDIYLTSANFDIAYENSKDNLVVLTEKELYGFKRHNSTFKSVFKEGSVIGSYEELSPGDYVVHENYGIGKYVGITTIDINGIHQDYMEVHYANNEKLFVPLYQFNLIRKYVGREGKCPTLSKLSTNQWEKTKQRIKNRVNELADRLLLLYQERQKVKGFSFKIEDALQANFENKFPYELTLDQEKAIKEIKADMESSVPMDHLLCGDVGFGKTEVAFRAAFKALNNGKQVAIMCPTTLLAKQHYDVAKNRFTDFDFGIGLLTRLQSNAENKKTLNLIRSGQINLVIGTHKLLSKDLIFKDLGLLIIDEEQRFGVEQKERIKEKFTNIDVLTLSATPIPRTLQSSLIGLKTTSTINTPPKERMPIQTYVIPFDLGQIKELIQRELNRQGQVFYIHNKIATIYERADSIQQLLPECRIGVIHAKMDKEEIEETMMSFYEGEIDVLVATSIIENGIDVRNANLMLIEDADKFGLAQLYQIKGRVGRGDKMAFAYLMIAENKKLNEEAKKRLKAIQDFTELGSGFKISQRDLLIRGAGDILGPEQAGFIDSIGIDMYIKILNETIDEKKHKNSIIKKNKISDIRLDGYIPSSFANDENKLELYQKIIECRTLDQLAILKQDVRDIYGNLKEEVETLFLKKQIDIFINQEEFDSLKEFENNIQLILSEEFSDLEGIASELFTSLLPIIKQISLKYENRRIKITINKNYDYVKLLLQILNVVVHLYKIRKGVNKNEN